LKLRDRPNKASKEHLRKQSICSAQEESVCGLRTGAAVEFSRLRRARRECSPLAHRELQLAEV